MEGLVERALGNKSIVEDVVSYFALIDYVNERCEDPRSGRKACRKLAALLKAGLKSKDVYRRFHAISLTSFGMKNLNYMFYAVVADPNFLKYVVEVARLNKKRNAKRRFSTRGISQVNVKEVVERKALACISAWHSAFIDDPRFPSFREVAEELARKYRMELPALAEGDELIGVTPMARGEALRRSFNPKTTLRASVKSIDAKDRSALERVRELTQLLADVVGHHERPSEDEVVVTLKTELRDVCRPQVESLVNKNLDNERFLAALISVLDYVDSILDLIDAKDSGALQEDAVPVEEQEQQDDEEEEEKEPPLSPQSSWSQPREADLSDEHRDTFPAFYTHAAPVDVSWAPAQQVDRDPIELGLQLLERQSAAATPPPPLDTTTSDDPFLQWLEGLQDRK